MEFNSWFWVALFALCVIVFIVVYPYFYFKKERDFERRTELIATYRTSWAQLLTSVGILLSIAFASYNSSQDRKLIELRVNQENVSALYFEALDLLKNTENETEQVIAIQTLKSIYDENPAYRNRISRLFKSLIAANLSVPQRADELAQNYLSTQRFIFFVLQKVGATDVSKFISTEQIKILDFYSESSPFTGIPVFESIRAINQQYFDEASLPGPDIYLAVYSRKISSPSTRYTLDYLIGDYLDQIGFTDKNYDLFVLIPKSIWVLENPHSS
ncbi:MAG: hypothetical protein AAF616_13155 [Bacteroidota bacterium]